MGTLGGLIISASTRDKVIAIVVSATGLGSAEGLDENTSLVGGGISLDSVGVLELLLGLEREFGIELTPDELMQARALETVGTLAAFVDSKGDS